MIKSIIKYKIKSIKNQILILLTKILIIQIKKNQKTILKIEISIRIQANVLIQIKSI